ncbi:MAG TPA: DUF2336 domain-containing protein [Rhodospirillaceae bacterium]|nr:DUF2336 domain-containing protein [Rhodospirillaceae bacterium]
MATGKLSQQDVVRLMTERSAESRVATVAKLAGEFDQGELSDAERQLAEDIFRLLVKDAEVRVRQALAVHLKESAVLPHDVAVTLAQDVDQVALPILQYSKILTDQDLIAIVRSDNVTKQIAVTQRAEVSAQLSDALVETHNSDVVASLIGNQGAEISAQTLNKVEREFSDNPEIALSLQQRSVTLAERLMTSVSEQLEEQLVQRHHLSDGMAADIMTQSRERATIALTAGADRDDVEGLVRHLRANGRLTPSLMLRAICVGDTAFFEAGIAELAKVPVTNAVRLIHDPGRLGFRAIYDKAELPDAAFPAFRCAMDVAAETEFDGGEMDRERYCRRMVERILTQYELMGVNFDSGDLDYLLARIKSLPSGSNDDKAGNE